MEERTVKIYSENNPNIALKIIPGHFATNHSHINFYVDLLTSKTRMNEAMAIAKELKQNYLGGSVVDTIICMDGCEVIGAYLAEELSNAGVMNYNQHKTIYVVSPEYNSNNQIIFRDNMVNEVRGKHCLLLLASATTGKTIYRSLECVKYYGGTVEGIAAIFSKAKEVEGIKVSSVFSDKELPGYTSFKPEECPFCKQGIKIDAMVNSFGYSKL